jgi:predicted aspartyl protease
MRSTGGPNAVGRFSVDLEIANNDDLALVRRGLLAADQVRRETIRGVVDSGAIKLVLPADLVKRLGLPLGEAVRVSYADGRKAKRSRAEEVHVKLLGRHGIFTAVVEPRRATALVGAIVLEDLDLLVDCVDQRLVPRDPRGETFEIE